MSASTIAAAIPAVLYSTNCLEVSVCLRCTGLCLVLLGLCLWSRLLLSQGLSEVVSMAKIDAILHGHGHQQATHTSASLSSWR